MTELLARDSVQRHVLPNGLTVLIRRDASAPVAAIVTHVKAGYFDETDDVVGIAHVLEHMYFKGTPRRGVGEIAKQTKAVGGYLNAGTIYDHTVYYTVVPSSGFVDALDIQADAYANSLIDAGELSRELEVIIQEARRKADNPGAVAIETLYEMLHDRHRMRRWRIGREDGLRRLTRDDVLRFYRNYYRPSTTVLSVVGDVDPAAALREIQARYGALPSGEPERTPASAETSLPGFRYRELSGDVAQTQVGMAWRTVPTLHADTPALDVLAIVLGTGRASRLYRAVRERKLAATVGAFNYTPTELGVFGVESEGAPDTAAQAARALWAQVAALREHGVADVEIERAQRIIESRVIRRLEDMEGQATYLAEWEALGGWTLGDDYFDRLMAVTPDDVARVARHYLDPTQASVLVYRPDGVEGMAADTDAMRAWLDGGGVPGHAAATPPATASAARRTAAATFEREEAGVRVYRTPRGVPVLVRRKPGSPMVHISAQALGGAVHEPESHAGLTTLMARTALKGTASRSAQQIAEAGELLGGSVGASVAGEAFGWSISVPARRFSEALELLADVVQDPVFPDDALETERSTALAEVRALRDDMYRYPMRLASRVAFAGHPYGVPASGTEESLARLTLDDVRAWHADAVRRAPSVIGIVGDADPDDLAQHAARAFASLEFTPERAVAAPTWPGAVQVAAETREKAQTALLMLFQGPSRRDDDRFAAGLIATVASGLGGRFFDELRERQSLAYTVHAFSSVHRMAGSFGAYIATSPDREEVARAGLLAEFEKLRQEPVSEDELARAKVYALGTHAIRLQRGSAVLGDMLDAWLNGSLPELEEFEARVRAVTREQMLGVARRCFDPMRRVEGAVRGGGARQPQG